MSRKHFKIVLKIFLKTMWERHDYMDSVDYDLIAVNERLDIHKYLMENNRIA